MKGLSLLAALALVASLGAGERLKVRVSHTAKLAPAELLVQAIVEPAAENGALEVVAESADFYRSSLVQLDGLHSPRVSCIWFAQMPAGTYEVSVRVLTRDGGELAAETESVIIG